MVKKILSLTVAIMLLSVTVFATVTPVTLAQASEEPVYTWADGTSKIESLAIGDNTHLADLEAWDGETISESLTGAGTEASPYQIATGADLRKFADIVNTDGDTDAWAVLTSDINMGGKNWTSYAIGTTSAAYVGTFDGQGYTIYNLSTISSTNSSLRGLFGVLSGTAKNFNIVDFSSKNNVKTNGSSRTGAVCGTLDGGTIEKVTATGKIFNGGSSYYLIIAGGIAGFAQKGATITNCKSSVEIDLTESLAKLSSGLTNAGIGGIVGTIAEGTTPAVTVSNCGYSGTINAPQNVHVGGIVGYSRDKSSADVLTLENCYNQGDITGLQYVAGIIGRRAYVKSFTAAAYNTGTIVARETTSPYVAGIANHVNRKTSENAHYVYSSGDVQVKADENASDTFTGVLAGMLFTKSATVSSKADLGSQWYYALNATYTPVDSEEAIAKPINGFTDGGAYPTSNISAYRPTADGFGSASVLERLNQENTVSDFAADIGINDGKPILGWQANNLQLTGSNYEITAEKPMTVSLSEPGYFQVEVTSIAADNVDIVLTDAQGNAIETKTAGKMGNAIKLTFNSGDATEVKFTTAGRAIVTKNLTKAQTSGTEMTQLTNNNSKVIKTTIPVDALDDGDLAALVYVHYESDGTIRGIYYNKVTVANGKAAAVVDLSAITIKAGDVLKAYLWDGVTLAPVLETPEQLNQAV